MIALVGDKGTRDLLSKFQRLPGGSGVSQASRVPNLPCDPPNPINLVISSTTSIALRLLTSEIILSTMLILTLELRHADASTVANHTNSRDVFMSGKRKDSND